MKRVLFALIITAYAMNVFAQPKFEKLYQGSDDIISLGGNFFAVKKDSKWAVMKNKTMILDFFYDSIDILSDGIITYIKNDQAGFADTLGNIITIASYPLETPYNRSDESILNTFQSGSALVYDGEKLILLGKDGKQINENGTEIVAKTDNVVIFKKKAAYGLLDAMGNELAPNKYRRIQTVIAGELYAYTAQKDGMDVLGLIDGKGKVKSEALFDDLTIINQGDKFYIKGFVSNGKQALFDASGNEIFSPVFQNVEPIDNEKYFVYTENTRKGLIGRDYMKYIPAAYDNLNLVCFKKDTLFIAKNDNKTYILTPDNKTLDVLEGNIKDFISYNKNGEIVYIADSMLNYGIRSNKRGWLVEPKYLDVFAQSKDIFIVREKDKWGGIDINGQVKIPFEYKKVRASTSKTCIVFYDGKNKSLVLKDNGQQIDFPKTDNALPKTDYVEYKVKNEKVRLYFDGSEVKDKFKTIGVNKNGILVAKNKKGWSYFDSKTYDNLTDEYFDFATGFTSDGAAYVVKDKKLLQIDRQFTITRTILDDNYKNLNDIANILLMSEQIKRNTVIVTDKNDKKTLLKIIR